MPAQAIALIVIKTVTTKGNIMKKYPINKDFDIVKFLTFPVIPQAAPIARGILKTCILYTSPSPRDPKTSRMPSYA